MLHLSIALKSINNYMPITIVGNMIEKLCLFFVNLCRHIVIDSTGLNITISWLFLNLRRGGPPNKWIISFNGRLPTSITVTTKTSLYHAAAKNSSRYRKSEDAYNGV